MDDRQSNGGSLYDLQKILGHSDFKTTQIYAHLSQGHIKEKMNLICFGSKKMQPMSNVVPFKKDEFSHGVSPFSHLGKRKN